MTDKSAGGYENDLRDAENAMAAAGHPDIALGMRRHSEAQRNMMQGVLVPMFVQLVEKSLDTKLNPLFVLVREVQDAQRQFHERLTALEANTLADVITEEERAHLIDLARTIPDLAARVAALEARGDG